MTASQFSTRGFAANAIAIAAFLATTTGLCFAPAAAAYRQSITGDGAPHHWTQRTLTIRADVKVGDLSLRRIVAGAADRWTLPVCSTLSLLLPRSPARVPNIVVQLVGPGKWTHGPSEAAHTTVDATRATGAIQFAKIELDGARTYFSGTPIAGALDLDAIIAHELGHAIGLGHSSVDTALMRPGVKPGVRLNAELKSDDVQGLCRTYGAKEAARPTESKPRPISSSLPPVKPPKAQPQKPDEIKGQASTPDTARRQWPLQPRQLVVWFLLALFSIAWSALLFRQRDAAAAVADVESERA